MSEIVEEFLAAEDVDGIGVPGLESLRQLSGLNRADAAAIVGAWEEWSEEAVGGTFEQLVQLAEVDSGVEFDELFAQCMSQPDDEIRATAVSALTGNGDSQLIEPLCALLLGDSSWEVRSRSAIALGAYAEYADAERISAHRAERILAVLSEAIDDPAPEVSGAALVAYAGMPDSDSNGVIDQVFDPDSDDSEALAFVYAAMGRSSGRHWLSEVLHAFDHPSAQVRRSATLAYGELADPDDDLGCLEAQIDDEDLEVQLAAITALMTIGTQDARTMLTQAAQDTTEPAVRELAEDLLSQLSDEDELSHAVTPEMMEAGLYGGGGTGAMERDVGRYDARTLEGWADIGEDGEGKPTEDADIGEDLEDYYESDEFWRGMN